jgi:hypothetical protein
MPAICEMGLSVELRIAFRSSAVGMVDYFITTVGSLESD